MANTWYLSSLAHHVGSRDGQSTFAKVWPDHRIALAGNRYLDEDVWMSLFEKAKINIAAKLTERTMTDRQIRRVIRDKRITVRDCLFLHGMRDSSMGLAAEIVAMPWFEQRHARLWTKAKTVPDNVYKEVLRKADGEYLVRALTDRERYTDAEAMEELRNSRPQNAHKALWRLFDLRPELLPAAVLTDSWSVKAAALGSRHLFDDVLAIAILDSADGLTMNKYYAKESFYTALANPNMGVAAVKRALELIGTANHSSGLSRLRLVSDLVLVQRRTIEVLNGTLVPVANPWHLTAVPEELDKTRKAIAELMATRYPSLSAPWVPNVPTTSSQPKVQEPVDLYAITTETPGKAANYLVTAALSEKLDPYGESGWEAFWSLYREWNDSLGTLCDAAIALVR